MLKTHTFVILFLFVILVSIPFHIYEFGLYSIPHL